jgi:hypothetical protein
MNTTVLTRAGWTRPLLAPAQASAPAQDPVKLGLIVPLSGPWARQGEVMRFGAEMAVDHINAAGGIASSETLTPASSLATFRAGQEVLAMLLEDSRVRS